MITVRAPLRISLAGGGTDLPSYYREHGGLVLSAAIDKYVYVQIHENFTDDLILHYARHERVISVEHIQHPIIRQVMIGRAMNASHLEIASLADIPAGTGLGSSSSFTVALIRALDVLVDFHRTTQNLAEYACSVEIDQLGEPIGKQDQYIAAFGGVRRMEFKGGPGFDVQVKNLQMDRTTLYDLEDSLALYFTGFTRSASDIMAQQDSHTKQKFAGVLHNLHQVKQMAVEAESLLGVGDLCGFGRLMDRHWQLKKERSGLMTNPQIDHWYDIGMRNGAVGGKLVGAGGGGFLLFVTEDRPRLRKAMAETGLREVRFRFDMEGAKVMSL